MANTTRRAAWRSGPANGWHDDLVWYAAAIHQMRALTPDLDDFLQIYRDFEAEQISGPSRWPAARGDHREPVGRPAEPRLPVAGARHLRGRSRLARTRAAGPVAGVRARPLVLPAVAPRLPARVRGRGARAHRGSSAARPPTGHCPYWNYSDFAADPQRLGLPLPLRGETLPADVDGAGRRAAARTARSPTRCSTRRGRCRRPDARDERRVGHATGRPAAPALRQPAGHRARSRSAAACWRTRTTPALFHDAADEIGQLDVQPHGSVHVAGRRHDGAVRDGRRSTRSSGCTTATSTGSGRPTPTTWGTATRSRTASGAGTAARSSRGSTSSSGSAGPTAPRSSWTAPDVLDIDEPRLRLRHHRAAAAPAGAAADRRPAPRSTRSGSTSPRPSRSPRRDRCRRSRTQEFVLSGGADGDQGLGVDAFPEGAQWLLRFDGIRSTGPAPTSYEVYLGLEPGATPTRTTPSTTSGCCRCSGSTRPAGTTAPPPRTGSAGGSTSPRRWSPRPRRSGRWPRPGPAAGDQPGPDLAGVGLSIERMTLEFA